MKHYPSNFYFSSGPMSWRRVYYRLEELWASEPETPVLAWLCSLQILWPLGRHLISLRLNIPICKIVIIMLFLYENGWCLLHKNSSPWEAFNKQSRFCCGFYCYYYTHLHTTYLSIPAFVRAPVFQKHSYLSGY